MNDGKFGTMISRAAVVPALFLALALVAPIRTAEGEPATPEASEGAIRAAFDAFVAAQNAHDLRTVESLLLDSPSFLWVTRGEAIWGREAALERFQELYKGTWRLAPDMKRFRTVVSREGVAQIFVPILFTIGAPGEPAREMTFLMNQTLARTDGAWKIASILPIPAGPPPGAGPPPAGGPPRR